MWRYAIGQAIGSAHEKLKTPCQDRVSCVVVAGEDALVAVMADGAGSASLSHIGADLVVSTVSSLAQLGVRAGRRDYGEVLREAAGVARQRLIEEAQSRKVTLRDLACTLLAAIVPPVGGAALQLGDGAIVATTERVAWRCIFWPQKGEYANATHFLSDDNALSAMQVAALADEVLDVALLTDGLETLALQFATRAAHEPFFRTAFGPVHTAAGTGELTDLSRSLSQFLASPPVKRRTDDDASLILATRRAARA